MNSPKIICKSGYIKDTKHFLNILTYAGDKIAKQVVAFEDGSLLEIAPDEKINLQKSQTTNISHITLSFKDGGERTFGYKQYRKQIKEQIRTEDLVTVCDDSMDVKKQTHHELKDLDLLAYMKYTASRKGVEKSHDGHGLFGITGDIPISTALKMAEKYDKSRKWVHILSLPEGADIETGFNKREMWQALISSKAPKIAALYNIGLENLIINGAFHSNTENAHCHLMFYSKDANEGFIKGGKEELQNASEKLKSIFANVIYKDKVTALGATKTHARTQLAKDMEKYLENIQYKAFDSEFHPALCALGSTIATLQGKHQYGYLPKEIKNTVDNLLEHMITMDDDLKKLYQSFVGVQKQYIQLYTASDEKIAAKLDEFQKDFFCPSSKNALRTCHNLLVKYAEQIHIESERTAEGEFFDALPPDDYLSSLMDCPPPEERTAEGEFFDALPPDDYLSSLMDYPPPEERTAEGEFFDALPPDDFLSSLMDCPPPEERTPEGEALGTLPPGGYQSNSKPYVSQLSKKAKKVYYETLTKNKDFVHPLNRAIRKALDEALKKEHSNIQIKENITELKQVLSYTEKVNSAPVQELVGSIFSYLGEKDRNVANEISEYISKFEKAFDEDPDTAEECKARFKENLLMVNTLGRPQYTIVNFAENYDDFRYNTIIHSEKITSPLNKMLYKTLNQALIDTSGSFSSAYIMQELKAAQAVDKENPKKNQENTIQFLYNTDKDVRMVVDDTITNCFEKFKEIFGSTKALELIKTYKKDLFSSTSSLPSNHIVYFLSKNRMDNIYTAAVRKHRSFFGDITQHLKDTLTQPLPANIQLLLKQLTLSRMLKKEDKHRLQQAELFKEFTQYDPSLEHLVSSCIESFDQQFFQYAGGSDDFAWLHHKLHQDIYSAEACTGIGFCLDTMAAKYIFSGIQEPLKEFRSKLYKALVNVYCKQTATDSSTLGKILNQAKTEQDLCEDSINTLMELVSSKEQNFYREKEGLYQAFYETVSDTFTEEEARTFFNNHFYGSKGKFQTLQIKQMIEYFAANSAEIKPQYQKRIINALLRTLMRSIARSICAQAARLNEYNQKNKTKNPFRNATFKNRNSFHLQNSFQKEEELFY